MFDRLVTYKENNGFTKVPQKYPEDQSLGYWVSYQRKLFHKNDLSQDRLKLLKSIHFDWGEGTREPRKDWNKMFDRLVAYIPFKYHPDLARWKGNQRKTYYENK